MDGEAAAWGGYAVPTGGPVFGATMPGPTDTKVDPATRTQLEALAARLPEGPRAVAAARPSRAHAAVRATTLIDCGRRTDRRIAGLWIMGGLGSRGFCVAPLWRARRSRNYGAAVAPARALASRLTPNAKGPCATMRHDRTLHPLTQ